MVAGYAMSLLDFLPFRRRPRPPDQSLPPSDRPDNRDDGLPPVSKATRLQLVALLLSRP